MSASTGTATKSPAKTLAMSRTLHYMLILGGLTAFGPLSVDMYLPALPHMTGDLHTTEATLQYTLTAFIIGLSLGQLVAGPLSDAIGRRKPLLFGLVLYAVASVFCALSPSAELLIAGRALQALGAATGIVVARAVVRDVFSGTSMTKFFSLLMLVTGVGPVLAPLLGGQLLRLTSWRGIFVVLAVLGAAILVAVASSLSESLPAENRSPLRLSRVLRTYGSLLTDRIFVGYALALALLFAGLFAYISASSFVIQGVYGLSAQAYSILFGLTGLGIVLASQVNGRLVGRLPERRLLATGLTSAVIGGIGVLLAASLKLPLPVLIVFLLMQVSSMGLVAPNTSSLALANQQHQAGSASALLGVLQFLIGGLSSPLVTLGGVATAVPMGLVMAGFALAAMIVFVTMTRPRPAAVS